MTGYDVSLALPKNTYGDLLRVGSGDTGLAAATPAAVGDSVGNLSPVQLSQTVVNFDRSSGKQWQLDGVAITATAAQINSSSAGLTASFVVMGASASLANERVLTAGTGVTITDGGAGNNVVVAVSTTGVTAATYGDASHVAQVAVNAQGQVTSASSVSIAIAASQITSGQLAAARGGTGQDFSASTGFVLFTAGTASAVASTGSGNVVRATSPSITTPTISGGTATGLTGLAIRSTGTGAFDLTIANSENLTAGRTLTLAVNDAARTLTVAGNATVSGTNTGDQTITLTGDVTGTGTGSFATTVAKIAGTTVSGTSGSGNVAFTTSPTFTTPTLGAATATSINKVAITAPATSATLTIADGKTLTASNSITVAGTDGKTLTVSNSIALAGTDGTTMTFPPASASVGYLNVPQNSQSAAYTTVLADAGKSIYHPSTDANARTFTIDSNANVAYPIGTTITFVNKSANAVTIAITSDTLVWSPSGSTGSRTLAQYGVATAYKDTSTSWIITGTGLS